MKNNMPIQWKVAGFDECLVSDAENLIICTAHNMRDAEFIARACNNHDLLVQLLKEAAYSLRSAYGNSTAEEIRMDEMAAKIDAALILAEKK